MPLSRRTAIRQFLFVSAGVVFLPSCLHQQTKTSIALRHVSMDGDAEKMLGELAATIIPTTTTPGAREVSAHLFVMTMVDDCFSKNDQQKWLNGMAEFEKRCSRDNGHSFVQCDEPQREALLSSLETAKDGKDDISFFYHASKRLVIQAYTSSKYYLTNVRIYELVPSRFKGCVPLKPTVRKIA